MAQKGLLAFRNGSLHFLAVKSRLLVVHFHIFQDLGIHVAALGKPGKRQVGFHHDIHQHQRRHHAVAGVGVFAEDHMARLLAAEEVALLLHAFIDKAVSHLRLLVADAVVVEGLV